MAVPQRFKLAYQSVTRRVWAKWYWAFPIGVWELLKDRAAEWANDAIDTNASAAMKEGLRLFEFAAAQPFFWTLLVLLAVIVVVFAHAYFTDKDRKSDQLTQSPPASDGQEAAPIRRDVWLKDAITYIVYREWGRLPIDTNATGLTEEQQKLFPDLLNSEMAQRGFDDELPIWGNRRVQEFWEPIEPSYWENYGLDYFSYFRADPSEMQTEHYHGRHDEPIWRGLKTSKQRVEEIWPPENKRHPGTALTDPTLLDSSEKLSTTPALMLIFDEDVPGCVSQTTFTEGPRVKFFRVKVECQGTDVLKGCAGHLISIEKNGQPTRYADSLQLTFAPAEADDALAKTIASKVPQYLDVCFVIENNQVGLATKNRVVPNSIVDLFNEPGDYKFEVVASSKGVDSQSIELVLHRTGDWQTTMMEVCNVTR